MRDHPLEVCPEIDQHRDSLQQAISGKVWNGSKLVKGRSNRKYTSEAVVAATVESAGFDPYESKVLGVTSRVMADFSRGWYGSTLNHQK